MLILGYLCALVIGLTLGMLGGGGSILTVPVFVYVLGYDPRLAIAMSLPVVGVTSLVGAIDYWREGSVRLPTAVAFGAATMSASFLAARLSVHLAGAPRLVILGITVLAAATVMLRDSFRLPASPRPVDGGRHLGALALGALVVGALTGVIGVAGGFLIVPVLVVFAKVPMRQAVGTSLTVITLNALAAFAGQSSLAAIPADVVLLFSLVAIAGMLAGTRLARLANQRTLKRGFAVLLLVIGPLVLWRSQAAP